MSCIFTTLFHSFMIVQVLFHGLLILKKLFHCLTILDPPLPTLYILNTQSFAKFVLVQTPLLLPYLIYKTVIICSRLFNKVSLLY
jgi:hypothetical protein